MFHGTLCKSTYFWQNSRYYQWGSQAIYHLLNILQPRHLRCLLPIPPCYTYSLAAEYHGTGRFLESVSCVFFCYGSLISIHDLILFATSGIINMMMMPRMMPRFPLLHLFFCLSPRFQSYIKASSFSSCCHILSCMSFSTVLTKTLFSFLASRSFFL